MSGSPASRWHRLLPALLMVAILVAATLVVIPSRSTPLAQGSPHAVKSTPAAADHLARTLVKSLGASTVARFMDNESFLFTIINATPYAAGVGVTPAELRASWHLDFDWGAFGSGFLEGCVVGGITGGIAGSFIPGVGTAVGAGIGCVIGGAIEGIWQGYNTKTVDSLNFAVEQAKTFALAAALYDDWQYASGLVLQAQQALNSTQFAWDNMADSAARSALLPNTTWDPVADMAYSGVADQMSTLLYNYMVAAGAAYHSVNLGAVGIWGPGGVAHSSCNFAITAIASNINWGCGAGNTIQAQAYYQQAFGTVESTATDGTGIWFMGGSHVYITCTAAATITQPVTFGGGVLYSIPSGLPVRKIPTLFTNGGPAVIHISGGGSPTCTLDGHAYILIPTSANTAPASFIRLTACGANVDVPSNLTTCDIDNVSQAGASNSQLPASYCVHQIGGSPCASSTYILNGVFNAYSTQLDQIMVNAETNAQTYWTFLHFLGFFNSNQIPSNCAIPMPIDFLPPQVSQSLGTLTLNQTLALYLAWLNDLAVFFGVGPNATNFCSGHSVFNVKYLVWNLNVITTGFVLTVPKANQTFGNRSTWTITNASATPLNVGNATLNRGLRTDPAPIVVWPMVKTLYVHVGVVQEIPIDNTVAVFSPLNGTLYTLNGNGTAQGSTGNSTGVATSNFGAAIYLSSCSQRNSTGSYIPVTICPLVLSNLSILKINVTCPLGTNPDGSCVTGGGGPVNLGCAGGDIFLIGPLVNAIAGPLSSVPLIGAAACDIVWVIVVVVLIFIAIAIVLAVGRRAFGGSSK